MYRNQTDQNRQISFYGEQTWKITPFPPASINLRCPICVRHGRNLGERQRSQMMGSNKLLLIRPLLPLYCSISLHRFSTFAKTCNQLRNTQTLPFLTKDSTDSSSRVSELLMLVGRWTARQWRVLLGLWGIRYSEMFRVVEDYILSLFK